MGINFIGLSNIEIKKTKSCKVVISSSRKTFKGSVITLKMLAKQIYIYTVPGTLSCKTLKLDTHTKHSYQILTLNTQTRYSYLTLILATYQNYSMNIFLIFIQLLKYLTLKQKQVNITTMYITKQNNIRSIMPQNKWPF